MWHEYPDQAACIPPLAQHIAGHLRNCLKDAALCTLAVSGGRSPIPLFEALAGQDLDWSRIRVRLVDERWVPPGHPDSNENLVRRHLLTGPAAAADFCGLYLPGQSIEAAVAAANHDFRGIDVVLLGMGEDGHMASLFPSAPQLHAALAPNAACYLHLSPPEAPHERLSLSLAALQSSRHRILYISGGQKRKVLQQAQSAMNAQLPISLLAAEPGADLDVHWHP